MKKNCKKCNAEILESTYKKHDGLCMPCYKLPALKKTSLKYILIILGFTIGGALVGQLVFENPILFGIIGLVASLMIEENK